MSTAIGCYSGGEKINCVKYDMDDVSQNEVSHFIEYFETFHSHIYHHVNGGTMEGNKMRSYLLIWPKNPASTPAYKMPIQFNIKVYKPPAPERSPKTA